jgi:hypothetical protein
MEGDTVLKLSEEGKNCFKSGTLTRLCDIKEFKSLRSLVIETVKILKMTVTFFVFEDFYVIPKTLNIHKLYFY